MLTGQQVNSLHKVQVPVQNCINSQYIMKQAAHGVKEDQVSFPTHPAMRHLEFSRRSYGQNIEGCSEVKQSRGISSGVLLERSFHTSDEFKLVSCFHLSWRVVPSINTPLCVSYKQVLMI